MPIDKTDRVRCGRRERSETENNRWEYEAAVEYCMKRLKQTIGQMKTNFWNIIIFPPLAQRLSAPALQSDGK